jgi:hypothetical protein
LDKINRCTSSALYWIGEGGELTSAGGGGTRQGAVGRRRHRRSSSSLPLRGRPDTPLRCRHGDSLQARLLVSGKAEAGRRRAVVTSGACGAWWGRLRRTERDAEEDC